MATDSAKLPSLFGRATAVFGEHAHLLRVARNLQRACRELAGASEHARNETERLVAEFEQRLLGHFATEEADGYFGTVVLERPDLVPRVAELRAEHARIRRQLTMARAQLAGEAHPEEAAERLGNALRSLDAHERAESALMSEFLGRASSA